MTPDVFDSLSKEELVALVLAQQEQIRLLTARVAELEAKLNIPPKTPSNSSLPPSKGQKANRPGKAKKPRKGRPGVARKLAENPDHVREVFAGACPECGKAASPGDQPNVHAYDHIDLPEIKPVVTRINIHSGNCVHCGKRVAATPPADMPAGSPFGPGIAALAVYLHTRQMVSYNRLVEMMKGLFGLEISEGAIANMFSRAAEPFTAEAERIDAEVRTAPVIASDETSARVEGQTCWQWVFGSATAVAHRIAASRGKAVAADFLAGAKPQVWISDRLSAQTGHAEAHQVCLAHLQRDARYAVDAGDKLFAPGFKFLLKRASPSAGGAGIWRTARFWPTGAIWIAASGASWRLSPIRCGAQTPARHRKMPGQAIRLRHPQRRAAHQQRVRAPAAPIGDLPQGDQRLPLCLGRQGLRRGLFRHRYRNAARPDRVCCHPHLPRWRNSAHRALSRHIRANIGLELLDNIVFAEVRSGGV